MRRKELSDLLEEIGTGRYDCLVSIRGMKKKTIIRGAYSRVLDVRIREGEKLTDSGILERIFSPNPAKPGEAWELTSALNSGDGIVRYAEEIADLYFYAARYKGEHREAILNNICRIGRSLGFGEEQVEDLCLVKYIERIVVGKKDHVKERNRIAAYLNYIEHEKKSMNEEKAMQLLEKFKKRYNKTGITPVTELDTTVL